MSIKKIIKSLSKYIIIIFIFTVFQVACELLLPDIMASIVDKGIINQDKTFIIMSSLKMLGFAVLSIILTVITMYNNSKFSALFAFRTRKSLYEHINTLSKKDIEGIGVSSLITRCNNDVANITNVFSMLLHFSIFAIVMGIGGAYMAYKTEPSLLYIVVISITVLVVLLSIMFLLVMKKMDKALKLIDKLNNKTREILNGIRVIKAFNKRDYFSKRFEKVNNDNYLINKTINKIMFLMEPITLTVVNLGSVAIIYFSIDLINKGIMNVGSMMAYIQYMAIILSSFLLIMIIIVNIPRTFVSIKRINEVLKTKSSIKDKGKEVLKEINTIEFKHVFFKYENSAEYTLRDINFKIDEKDNIGIIGSSGSGKSTICSLLLRSIEPTKGEILINGIEAKNYSLSSLRKSFSYIPQKSQLFKGTIKENLCFDNNYCIEQLDNACENACVKDLVYSKENTYDFLIEETSTNLSGGEKQRLSIARALLVNSSVLLFDDSFSALDYITDKKLRNNIKEKYENK
ncbi:MAG: ABC transporter ATP-binding protein, partial [Clostridia bacterium]